VRTSASSCCVFIRNAELQLQQFRHLPGADPLWPCPSRDQIKSELRWLEEQGLVTVEDIETVLVARLTERGADVAAGRAIVLA
jgi:hypothetical protein